MIKYVALWLFSVTISAFAQVMLKKSANRHYDSRIREYLNWIVILSYGLFFISTILTMLAMRRVPYAFSPMIEGFSYILIPVFGVLILRERIPRRRLIGIAIILAGSVIYTSGLMESGAVRGYEQAGDRVQTAEAADGQKAEPSDAKTEEAAETKTEEAAGTR